MPKCKYKCKRCSRYFQESKPRMVSCPNCGHEYVEWLNHQEIVDYLMRNDGEYITSYNQVSKEDALEILKGLKDAIERNAKPFSEIRRTLST